MSGPEYKLINLTENCVVLNLSIKLASSQKYFRTILKCLPMQLYVGMYVIVLFLPQLNYTAAKMMHEK